MNITLSLERRSLDRSAQLLLFWAGIRWGLRGRPDIKSAVSLAAAGGLQGISIVWEWLYPSKTGFQVRNSEEFFANQESLDRQSVELVRRNQQNEVEVSQRYQLEFDLQAASLESARCKLIQRRQQRDEARREVEELRERLNSTAPSSWHATFSFVCLVLGLGGVGYGARSYYRGRNNN